MTVISFTVTGRPVPAVRMTQKDKWKPSAQRYLDYKLAVGWKAKEAKVKMITGNVGIRIKLYVSGHPGDWDNISKAICDGLNGIAYVDDRQIVEAHVWRHNCKKHQERAEVEVWEVG